MDSNENKAGKISVDRVKSLMNEVLLPIPRLWIVVTSVATVISLFEVAPTARGLYAVSFRLTWVTVLLLALVWLPFLLKVLALSGGGLKGFGGEATFEGLGEILSQLSPEEELQVLPSFIAATKRSEETSTELEREKLRRLRKDLEERLAALSETGTLYEKLRSDMPSGPARTAELEKVMAKARVIAKDTEVSAKEAKELFDPGSEGNRIAAIALAQEKRNPEFFPFVIRAIAHPATPFEHYHALEAAYLMLPKLNEAQTQQLGIVVKDQQGGRVYYFTTNKIFRPVEDPYKDIPADFDKILDAIGEK
jgi:hypothetical protein